MQGIKNALKGVQYSNPQLGERLYELCRKATSRHIDRPDEILNQQVVYMINSDMNAYGAGRDAVTCLKRRLQMDHPQKQYLAIILTSKVLQECHAALGMYQGELLQEVAYILRTQHTSSPAAARTRQAAMDALRHFGAGGVDAYRQARQQGGVAPGMPAMVQRDPAAIAAERESLLDEVNRLVEQARTSAELLNELILSKSEAATTGSGAPDESAALRRELLSDVRELRRLLDGYMSQLASLSGADAEGAMKKALEAVDQLDAALTLEKDVDAEIKDLREKGQLPEPTAATATPAALPPPGDAGASSSSSAAAAAAGASAAAAAAAAKMQSMNLIDLDDEPAPAAPAATAAAAAAADPFGMGPAPVAPPLDPFALAAPPPAAAAPYMSPAAADMFGRGGGPAAVAAFPAAPAAAHDPFAALAVAPTSTGVSAGGVAPSGFDEPPAFGAFPAGGPPPPAAAAAVQPAATSAGGADPFADAAPTWGPPSSSAPPAAAAAGGFDSLAAAAASAPASGRPSSSSGGAAPAASIPQQQQLGSAGMSGGGVGLPYGQQPAAAAGIYGAYGAAAATAGLPASGSSGGAPPYGPPQMGGPGGMLNPYGPAAGMTGGPGPYPYAGMPTGGYGGYGGYGAPGPYGMPMGQATGQMGMGQVGPYPQGPSSAAYGAVPQMGQVGPYPAAAMGQQQQQMPGLQQQPPSMGGVGSMGGLAPVSAPPASYGGAAAAPDVVLSPTNPFASVPAGPAAVPVAAGGVGVGANPFGGSNVDQEWNAFFARGQTAGK